MPGHWGRVACPLLDIWPEMRPSSTPGCPNSDSEGGGGTLSLECLLSSATPPRIAHVFFCKLSRCVWSCPRAASRGSWLRRGLLLYCFSVFSFFGGGVKGGGGERRFFCPGTAITCFRSGPHPKAPTSSRCSETCAGGAGRLAVDCCGAGVRSARGRGACQNPGRAPQARARGARARPGGVKLEDAERKSKECYSFE